MPSKPVQASLIGRALGDYQVEVLIGRGAMGTVYLARDTRLNRPVALKVLLGTFAQSSKLVDQFHAEAHAAAPLRHENIVRIYTAGNEGGIPYIAMEFVDGEPLDRFLRRKGPLDWRAAMYIGGQVALALDCAHEHGVIHRDVKPSNILMDRKGRIRLTDFGIARMQHTNTQAGPASQFVGTPQYMSPEQCTGKPVGPPSDLFSLGVCMFQMITGQMPFEGESSMSLIKAICTDDPPRLNKLDPEVPDDVGRVVAYLLEKEPDMRPASARTAHALMRRVRKQSGGDSAVAESITDFLKSETEVRPFSRVYQERQSGVKRTSSIRKGVSISGMRAVLRYAAVTVCAAAAFATPLALAGRSAAPPVSPPPLLTGAVFETSPDSVLVNTRLQGFAIHSTQWAGDPPSLYAAASGQESSWGMLQIIPDDRHVASFIAPNALPASLGRMLGASLTDAGAFVAVRERDSGDVVVLRQQLSGAQPDAKVMVRIPWTRWTAPAHADLDESHDGTLVGAPKGDRLALLLWDPVGNGFGLYEHDPLTHPSGAWGAVRTSRRDAIFPDSIVYSPDGKFLAYQRHGDDETSELWLLETQRNQLDGELVALGVVRNEVSFSPDSRYIAVTTTGRDEADTFVRVIDVATGQTIRRIANAWVSRQSWSASTGALVFADSGDGERSTLWQIEPYRESEPAVLWRDALEPGATYSVEAKDDRVATTSRNGTAVQFYNLTPIDRRARATADR